MAKGIGLIGNFRGKVGNMVGYNLKDSNNKQTQGVRVYQPVVKNPKTYGQAEQRAKLAPINATYRALKAIIDRGQEGKAYGNKSRLAWLSDAMKAFDRCWFEKGSDITEPPFVNVTKGTLGSPFALPNLAEQVAITFPNALTSAPTTIGALSTALLSGFPFLKEGDQITFVEMGGGDGPISAIFDSIVINSTSTESLPSSISATTEMVKITQTVNNLIAGCIILSREGDSGQHLRSTTALTACVDYESRHSSNAAKEAAIKSYMSAGANTDWAEESLQ